MELRLKDNLRQLLQAKGLKAADLSRSTGLAPSLISEWLAGRAPRNIVNLQKVAQELQIPLELLCFGKIDELAQNRRPVNSKNVFPMILPINESGILEFQVRWTRAKDENGS